MPGFDHAPQTIRLFDWGFDAATVMTKPEPRSIFISASQRSLREMINICRFRSYPDAAIVIGGCDTRLSENRLLVEQLRDSCRFRRIFYEAVDVEVPGVMIHNMGFNNAYLAMDPYTIRKAIETAALNSKTRVVAAAYNYINVVGMGLGPRGVFERFLSTERGAKVEIIRGPPPVYWPKLAESRFFLVPTGSGIQAPKLAEALIVLAIPICLRENIAFRELAARYPIVLIDRWEEATEDSHLVRWWNELSPRLEAARLDLLAERWFGALIN